MENNNNNKLKIPLARRTLSTFRVGVDRLGYWVALDQDGRCGGLFVGRNEAVRFALSQNGNRPEHVLLVDSSLELDFETTRSRPAQLSSEPSDLDLLAEFREP